MASRAFQRLICVGLICPSVCLGTPAIVFAQPSSAPASPPSTSAQPAERIDCARELTRLMEPFQREGNGEPNAWPKLEEARRIQDQTLADLYRESQSLREYANSEGMSEPDWRLRSALLGLAAWRGEASPEIHGLADEYLHRLELAHLFDLIAEVASAHHVTQPPAKGRLLEARYDPGDLHGLCRACAARAGVAVRRGDDDAVVSSVEQIMALARISTHQGSFDSQVAGGTAVAVATHIVQRVTLGRTPDPVLCGRLLAAIDRQADLAPPTLVADICRLEALDGIDGFFESTCKGATEGMAPEKAAATCEAIRRQGLPGTVASQPEQNAKAEGFFKAMREMAEHPYFERRRLGLGIPDEFAELPDQYEAFNVVQPNVSGFLDSRDRASLFLAGARLMLALESFRAKHTEYPEKLSDLVPELLKELPGDPFSAEGFRYRRIDAAQDPDHRGYLLYSVGRDGEDNGGRECPDGPQNVIGRAVRGRGFDYVINSPRD